MFEVGGESLVRESLAVDRPAAHAVAVSDVATLDLREHTKSAASQRPSDEISSSTTEAVSGEISWTVKANDRGLSALSRSADCQSVVAR